MQCRCCHCGYSKNGGCSATRSVWFNRQVLRECLHSNIQHHQSRLWSACVRAEFEEWHSDLKWMQQTFAWPAHLQTQCGPETNLSKFCILLQPHHITSYCQSMVQSNQGLSQLDTARQHRLLTAVSRISMHQRMHIVFMGYRARFAEVGICTPGESGMLTQNSESTCGDGICCRCPPQPSHLSCASMMRCSVMKP